MCGIFGTIRFDHPTGVFNEEEKLQRVISALHHRGPDASGTYISPDKKISMAHTRLSIIDLSTNAAQPMVSNTPLRALSYNGEIYNYQQLKSTLDANAFRSQSDTEVLFEGLQQVGPSFVNLLDGMFAFGYYDETQKSLFLATDAFGKKPLYTYWDGQTFAFASEIKAFFAYGLNSEISKNILASSFLYGYTPYPQTIYKNIRKLPPGSYQFIDVMQGPQPVKTYWDIPTDPNKSKIKYKEAKILLKDLLGKAVEKRLVADVEVGGFLSGGLDSSAICLEAAQRHPNFKTFSVAIKDASALSYDESPYAQEVANNIGSDHLQIDVSAYTSNVNEVISHFDEPFADSSAIPTYTLCREASKHVKVILSGDGGDEIFGGYRRFQATHISEQYFYLFRALSKIIKSSNSHPRSFRGYIDRLFKGLNYPLLERLAFLNSYFNPQELSQLLSEQTELHYDAYQRFNDQCQQLDLGERILYTNIKNYLYGDLLPKVDRMSMLNSLEVRSPFLDKELVEFAFSLPTKMKFDAFNTKKILKDAYRKPLGRNIVDRSKKGFGFPIEDFMKQQNLQLNSIERIFPKLNKQLLSSYMTKGSEIDKAYALWSFEQVLSKSKSYKNVKPKSPILKNEDNLRIEL